MSLVDLVQDFFEKQHYTEEGQQILDAFQNNPESIAECQRILQSPGYSTSVYFFFAKSLRTIVGNMAGVTWSFDQVMEVVTWILEYLRAAADQVDDTVIGQLAEAVARVMSVSILNERFAEAYSLAKGVCMNEPPSKWRVNHMVQASIVSSMQAQVKERPRSMDVQKFTQEVLPDVFQSGFDVVQRFARSEDGDLVNVCCSAMNVCHACLSFSMNPDLASERDSLRMVNMAAPSLKEVVSSADVVYLFFEFYKRSQKSCGLECVRDIVFMAKSSFVQDRLRDVLETILLQLREIIDASIGFDQTSNLHLLSEIVRMIGYKLDWTDLQGMQSIGEVLTAIFKFTDIVFEISKNGIGDKTDLVSNIMTFWTSLANLPGRYGSRSPLNGPINEQTTEIFRKYLEFLLYVVSQDMGMSKEILGNGKPSKLIGFFKDLAGQNTAQIAQALIQMFDKQKQDMESAMSQGNQQQTMILQSQLSLLTYVMTDILKKKMMGSHDVESVRCHPDILVRLVTLCNQSEAWLGSMQADVLEQSIIFFISQFQLTLFAITSPIQNQLYQSLSTAPGFREIASPDAMNCLLFKRLLAALRFPFALETLRSAATSISKIGLPSLELMAEIIRGLQADVFPFREQGMLENPDYRKLRNEFFISITDTVLKMPSEMLCLLLQSFTPSFSRLAESPLVVWGLAIDLSGVFTAIKKADHYTIAFSWLFPELATALVQIMPAVAKNADVAYNMLKLCHYLTLPSPHGRITFPPYSPNGIILFKHAAGIMAAYLTSMGQEPVQNDIFTEKYRQFKRCCQIFHSLLTSDVVLFDAFEIYSDPVFNDLLKLFFAVISEIDMSSLFEYPKVVMAMFNMLKALAANQLSKAIMCNPAFVPMITNLAITGSKSQSEKRDLFITSLHILSEVGRFAVENTGTPAADAILQNSELVNQTIAALWNLILSPSRTRDVQTIGNSLVPYLTINPGSIGAVKGSIAAAVPQAGARIEELFTAFQSQLTDAIVRGNSPVLSTLTELAQLVRSVNVQISF